VGILPYFQVFFPGLARQGRLDSSFFCSQSESTPAPPPLTQTVGRLAIVIKAVEILEHVYYNFC
jgi:hypothetical protein